MLQQDPAGRWCCPSGGAGGAFPTLAALAGSASNDVLDALEGPGLLRPARRLQQGASQLAGSRGWTAIRPRRSIAWPPQLEGWPGVAESPQHAGSILSSALTTCLFRSSCNVQRVLARLTASPRRSQRQLAGFLGNSVNHASTRSGPGRSTGPDGPGRHGLARPATRPATAASWQGHFAAYAAAIPLLTRERRHETLAVSGDWRGWAGMPAGRC